MIKCEKVSLSYPGRNKIFDDFSYIFKSSELYIVTGSSGVGKSTLIKSILGMKKPDSGAISHNGEDIYSLDEHRRAMLRGKIGYVPQGYSLIDSLSVLDNLRIASIFRNKNKSFQSENEKAELILGKLHIQHLKHLSAGKISGGEKRRVEIARAFLKGEQIIVMDEPTNDLDNEALVFLKALVQEYRKSVLIIISTHDPRMMDLPGANHLLIENTHVCQ